MLSSPAGSTLGLGTCVQVLPFQRSVTDRPLASSPTAHALVAEVALTLSSSLLPCGVGAGHLLPGGAIPVLDERMEGRAVGVVAHRPGIAGREHGNAEEVIGRGTGIRRPQRGPARA